MCHRCDEIDAMIAPEPAIDWRAAITLVNIIVEDLEAEKAKLHREDK